MIPVKAYNGQAVAVLGLGRSGLSAARSLKAGGATPVCWDDNENALSAADEEGFLIASLHNEQTWREHAFKALVLSPGIPHLYPEPNPVVLNAWKFGVPVVNDVQLFFGTEYFSDGHHDDDDQHHKKPNHRDHEDDHYSSTICITGSNGKSTTTALIFHILRTAGRNAQIGGNIGRGVLGLNPPRPEEIYVLELSSYQTDLVRNFTCDVGVFLNFSPDHYDRHGGRGGYFAAKKRLLESSMETVVGIDEDEGFFLYNALHVQSGSEEKFDGDCVAVSMKDRHEGLPPCEKIVVGDGKLEEHSSDGLVNSAEISLFPTLQGEHNHQNCAVAWAVCRKFDLKPEQILAGMKSFPGLPHRMERVGTLDNIMFVNDSKATNVEAAGKALEAFDNIYWIAGGQGKDGGLDAMKDYFPHINKAYLIGETATEFAGFLGNVPHEIAGTLDKAVDMAIRDARAFAGEAVVLLAPACASFDQFPSFEHRGAKFKKLVKTIIKAEK